MTALLSALLDLGIAAILFAAGWTSRGVVMESQAEAEWDAAMGIADDAAWDEHVLSAPGVIPAQRGASE